MAETTTPESDATDVSQPWDQDNQAWWDWYVSLAENDGADEAVLAAAPLPDVAIPTDDEVIAELAAPYTLTEDQIAFFRGKRLHQAQEGVFAGDRSEAAGRVDPVVEG